MNIYKWIYTKVTPWIGRPYTYLLRDLWHKCEFVWIMGLVALGVVLGHHYDWITILEVLGIFTVGFIFGHLFWGKQYVPGQKGDG